MSPQELQPKGKNRSRKTQTRAQDLLLALSRAAQSIQRAHTAEDFYQAVGREIQSLGGDAALLLFNEDRQSLSMAFLSYPPDLVRQVERMAGGLSMYEYRFPIVPGGIYERALQGRTAVYIASAIEMLNEILPSHMRAFSGELTSMFNLGHSVMAPLWVENETMGLLAVGGAFFSDADLPAMDSFAGQIATGLYNIRLMQKLQEELEARKQAEEALRISQATFEGIFNSVSETIYIQSEDGLFLNVNLGAERMYGYSREYFIGRTPEFLSAPGLNDFDKVAEYVRQAFLGQPTAFEFWGLRKDGTIFPKEVRLAAGTYYGRKVVIAVARDITERKKAEEEQRASKAKVQALLDSVPDMMFVLNRDGEFIEYYAGNEQSLHIPPDVFLGRNVRDLMPGDLIEKHFAAQEALMRTGKSQLFTYSLESSGQKRDFEAHMVTYLTDNILCVIRDVTWRREAEDELRRANLSLQAAHKELQQMFAHEQVLARTDVLTGLFNRRHFFDLATREFNSSLRYRRPLALILFDVDGFKTANDTFGHAFGDNILVKIAQAARSQVRDVDVLARYGGDEFIILMPETGVEQAFSTADRLRKMIESASVEADGAELPVTISVGLAEIAHDADHSVEAVISRADKALYQAKQAGRNHAVIYSDQ